jgi:hypothetical protein
MTSLRASLEPLSDLLEMTSDALYERQRALVRLGALKQLPGRGPGSGVPFTAQNFAVILISVLTAKSLSEVDEYVVEMCNAQPEHTLPRGAPREIWKKLGRPTFASDLGRVLSGQNTIWRWHDHQRSRSFTGVRVTRPWRAQIIDSPTGANPINYFMHDSDQYMVQKLSFTAEVGNLLLPRLIDLTKAFLPKEMEEDEE